MSTTKQINVCLLTGNFHDRQQVLEQLKSQLGDFELSVFDGSETFEYIYSQVISQSCFSEKRLLILNALPKYKGTQQTFMKKFKEMLKNVPEDCVVVLNNIQVSPQFTKYIKEIGKVFEYEKVIDRQEAPYWIVQELKKLDKKIEEIDADVLVESMKLVEYTSNGWKKHGVNVDSLMLSLNKLCSYLGNRKVVKREDVVAICIDSKEFIIWNLMNLLDDKNYAGATTMLAKAISPEKLVDESYYLMTTMLWRYKCLLYLKECMAQGWDEDKIKYEFSLLHKMKRSGLGGKMSMELSLQKDGKPQQLFSEAMMRSNLKGRYGQRPSVANYSRKELFYIVKAINEGLTKIRIGCTQTEVLLVFDSIFMMICGVVDYEESARLRSVTDGRFY